MIYGFLKNIQLFVDTEQWEVQSSATQNNSEQGENKIVLASVHGATTGHGSRTTSQACHQ